jgi:hypothetical protein
VARTGSAVIEIVQAMNVHAIVIRHRTLAMEGVDAAVLAKEMAGNAGIPAVLAQRIGTGQDLQLAFMHPRHQCVFLHAQRTIAGSEFFGFGMQTKTHCAAMTGAGIRHGQGIMIGNSLPYHANGLPA